MKGSSLWISSDVSALESDPETATLAIRLQLALNSLIVHKRTGDRLSGEPESAVRMREAVLSFLTTASYTKEALNVLTGVQGIPAESKKVSELATKAGVPPALTRTIGQLCGGTHPASPVLNQLRNKLGFHWDPRPLQASLIEFVANGTLVWAEGASFERGKTVHRLAIEVLSNAILPPDLNASIVSEERILRNRQRLGWAIRAVVDAARQYGCQIVQRPASRSRSWVTRRR